MQILSWQCLNSVANYPPNVFYLFLGGYILKNELALSKLKNLILSLMALQAELRGGEKEELGKAIDSLKRAVEKLKWLKSIQTY